MLSFVGRLSCRRRRACQTHALRFAGLIAFASAVFAQTPKPPELSLRFTVFSAKPVEGLTYLPRANVAPAKLVFYPTARSPRYEYRGGNPVRFTDASGAVVAEATVPPELRDVLLLVSPIEPAPASGVKFRVAVLDDGPAHHAAGGLAIINFSGLALSGTIDGKPATLKDGLNPTLAVGRAAKIALHTTLKGRTYQSYVENLTLKKNERGLLILFPPFYKGSLEVQSRLLIDEPPTATVPR